MEKALGWRGSRAGPQKIGPATADKLRHPDLAPVSHQTSTGPLGTGMAVRVVLGGPSSCMKLATRAAGR